MMKKLALVAAMAVIALTGCSKKAPLNSAKLGATAPSVALHWTQSPGTVTGNNVYRGASSGSEVLLNTSGPLAPTTTYTDAAVTAGSSYCYEVTALNSAAMPPESVKGNEVCVTIPVPAQTPVAPTGLTATPQSAGILLQWNPVAFAKPIYYNVFRCETDLGPCVRATQILQNPSPLVCAAYFDNQLKHKVKYAYWVQSTILTAGSPWSVGAQAVAP